MKERLTIWRSEDEVFRRDILVGRLDDVGLLQLPGFLPECFPKELLCITCLGQVLMNLIGVCAVGGGFDSNGHFDKVRWEAVVKQRWYEAD
jgi:hypothetical protein